MNSPIDWTKRKRSYDLFSISYTTTHSMQITIVNKKSNSDILSLISAPHKVVSNYLAYFIRLVEYLIHLKI